MYFYIKLLRFNSKYERFYFKFNISANLLKSRRHTYCFMTNRKHGSVLVLKATS